MKAVLLAGGLGTRISEESHLKPKPMIEVGGRPILWHIMKIYAAHGITDFVVCCGYKGYVIKEYFANYFLHMSDVTIGLADNTMEVHSRKAEPWRVTMIDTGQDTMTGGRIKRVAEHLKDTFCLTYGDGLSDVDIRAVIELHKEKARDVTLTAVQPAGRYGALQIDGDRITKFTEKPQGDQQWVNAGFMVCEPSIFDRLEGDETILEQEPLRSLAADGRLSVHKHDGFWAAMDTMRDKKALETLWASGEAPWRVWE